MEQNTQDWLRWRHTKLGSSDANIYMEKSKYKKKSQLILEKQTPFDQLEQKDSGPVAALGHVVEELERPRFELLMDKKFPAFLSASDLIPYLSASYDGMSEDKEDAWEHKLMGAEMFEKVVSKICPEEYYPQIQQQFFVTPSLKKIYLCCVKYEKEMLKGKIDPSQFTRAKMIVERDESYIQNKLLPTAKKTWDEILSNRDWTDLIKISRKRTKIKNLISKLEKKAKEFDPIIIEKLSDVGGSLSTETFSFNYAKQSRMSLDQEKMIEDGIDLSKYQKKSEFYVLKVTERKKKK